MDDQMKKAVAILIGGALPFGAYTRIQEYKFRLVESEIQAVEMRVDRKMLDLEAKVFRVER